MSWKLASSAAMFIAAAGYLAFKLRRPLSGESAPRLALWERLRELLGIGG